MSETTEIFTLEDSNDQIRRVPRQSIGPGIMDSYPRSDISNLIAETIGVSHLGLRITEVDGQVLEIYYRFETAKGYGDQGETVTQSEARRYEEAIEAVRASRGDEEDIRKTILDFARQRYDVDTNEDTGLKFINTVQKKFPLESVPYHEAPLVDDGDTQFRSARIRSLIIINRTQDLTLPHRLTRVGSHDEERFYFSELGKAMQEAIPGIKEVRQVEISNDFSNLPYVTGRPSELMADGGGTVSTLYTHYPKKSYFYQVVSGKQNFGKNLENVCAAGRDLVEIQQ